MKRVMVILLFMVFPIFGMAATIHVPGDQPTIQAGIDAAVDGDTVLVAPDTYVENINFLGKAITVISEQGPEVTIIDGSDPIQPLLGSVVSFGNGEGPDSVVEGFTLTNGTGDDWWGYGYGFGGGIFVFESSPTINNNIITNNEASGAGGGIYCYTYSSPMIHGNTITNNHTVFNGGGIFCYTYCSAVITNNIVSGNISDYSGGGIDIDSYSYVTCRNNTITGNSAQRGGGIHCHMNTDPTITKCTVSENEATVYGGGIFVDTTSVIITDCVISNNSVFEAGLGGGIAGYNNGFYLWNVTNCLIANNYAATKGGGLWLQPAPVFDGSNLTITGNTAGTSGGGLYYWSQNSVTLNNSIFWDNNATTGKEAWVGGSSPAPGILTIDYSDVEGGEDSIYVDAFSTLNWGVGMIVEDPLFLDSVTGDYHLQQDPCQPGVVNPCVDTGNPFSPMISGTTRTDCHSDVGIVDMGYHYALLDTVAVDLGCVPDSGVLPFAAQFSVTLGNAVAYNRTVAGRINLTLASGTTYQSWRAGYTNLGPNEMYVTSWMQSLPALGSLVGENVFELHAEDVTPSPYNQPPYPPAGDTATATCTVTGIAP